MDSTKNIKIDPNSDYKMTEVARPHPKLNPNGQGLVALGYLALRQRVLKGEIKARQDKRAIRTNYFIRGKDILDYLAKPKVGIQPAVKHKK